MNLLPNNSSLTAQKFAVLLDNQSKVNYEDLTNDPLTCDVSLLPHIAVIKGANIDNMLVHEARAYLKTFRRKSLGTIGAVEDAVNVFYDNAHVLEWFESDGLEVGMFQVDVKIKTDKSVIYDERLFKKSIQMINKSKNKRSKLEKISLKLPNGNTNINEFTGGVFGVNLKSQLEINSNTNITLQGGVAWMV